MERLHLSVDGVVQGVGFRPFVYRLALELGLSGWVLNTSGSVEIEVEGSGEAVAAFSRRLVAEAPPLSWIREVRTGGCAPEGSRAFEIRESEARPGAFQPLSPDIATCAACRREILDPADRRHAYPFTNCTDCGPRYTIIRDVPYDRPLTSMASFPMCPACLREYGDPLDRRFHAQPNACPVCGPRLRLLGRDGAPATAPALEGAVELLEAGGILGLKGLGGFHLACDATRGDVVTLLRTRKARGGKPLAVMLPDLDAVRRHCDPTTAEEECLRSPAAPIVLLPWTKERSDVAEEVAPGHRFLGVMLPSTPLHILLAAHLPRPLVMTSGNLSEEPIAMDNDEALRRLGGIADGFLLHDRDIVARCDDSVVLVERGEPRPLRRARGYAPHPLVLDRDGPQVLATGAQEKSTFTLVRGVQAFVSPHIGDLENLETLEHFRDTEARWERLFRVRPEVVAHDLHPDYLSTSWALERAARDDLPTVPCQHHHAHVVSCLADAGHPGPVLGVAFDGTGLGTDGTIWGGELLVATRGGFRRAGHLENVPMPGGAAAIRRPARMAASYLLALLEPDEAASALPRAGLEPLEERVVTHQARGGPNAPLTSSMGRLFDGVAALCGLGRTATYEGEAAILLEMQAHRGTTETGAYPFPIDGTPSVVRLAPLLRALLRDLDRGTSLPACAMRFHRGVAALVLNAVRRLREETGLETVALTGGVFQNRLLTRLAGDALAEDGFAVLLHRRVPCNDGGLSLGQAVIARHPGAEEVP